MKSSQISSKSHPKVGNIFHLKNVVFQIIAKVNIRLGLILLEYLSLRTFKNRPIWSHCNLNLTDRLQFPWLTASMRQYSDRSIISLIDLLSLILRSMNLPASTDPISLVLS